MLKKIPKDYHDASKGTLKLLWEDEWRAIGITQVHLRKRENENRNFWGALLTNGFDRVWVGSIMRYMSRNLTFFSSSTYEKTTRGRLMNTRLTVCRRPLNFQAV